MNFVRFTGELFIYYVLIALGGIVLTAITVMMFESVTSAPSGSCAGWMVPCGAMAAVIVGAWLVEAKKSVIENMAPVLTRLFTPLFTLVLPGLPRHHAVHRPCHRHGSQPADRLRPVAGAGRRSGAVCRFGA
jgi:hypothetical protein